MVEIQNNLNLFFSLNIRTFFLYEVVLKLYYNKDS